MTSLKVQGSLEAPAQAVVHESRSEPDQHKEVLTFDRRREMRSQSAGYARIICLNPYRSLLGSTAALEDISQSGIGLLTTAALEPGEFIEVRLAPFKVKGRVGIVSNCTPLDEPRTDTTGDEPQVLRYRVGVQYQRAIRAA